MHDNTHTHNALPFPRYQFLYGLCLPLAQEIKRRLEGDIVITFWVDDSGKWLHAAAYSRSADAYLDAFGFTPEGDYKALVEGEFYQELREVCGLTPEQSFEEEDLEACRDFADELIELLEELAE